MLSPLHEHPLEQVNPMELYQAYGGRWKCDNCNSENGAMNSFPFNCRQCSFDLCYSCMHMHHQGSNLIHQHQLLYMETSRLLYQNQNGIWRCAICKKASDTLRETSSFHCSTCSDFDICRNCYEPKRHLIHIHELKVVDTSLIYAHTSGSWVCDICGNSSRPYEVFSHHCGDCEFDVCQDCFKPHITPLHEHPLYRADLRHVYVQSNGGWRCDRCGSLHNNPVDNKPWHCQTCEFNLCNACMSSTIEAKKEFSEFRKETKKTGGGPPLKPPSQSSEQIIESFEDTPAVSGLNGFETGADGGAEEDACLPEECTTGAVIDESINGGVCVSSAKPAEVKFKHKKPLKRVSSDDISRMQYECLAYQKENLLLKNKKLKLEIQLLEQQVNTSFAK